MVLSVEESDKIKDSLLQNNLDNFPEDRRDEIRRQVLAMSPAEVENLVKQNQLTAYGDQCIVCAIAARNVKSFEVAEDKDNFAVLELTPLSKGHTIVFPKKHTDPISSGTKQLSEVVSGKLMQHFHPKKIQINEIKIMDHPVLEVIPIYGGETERSQASPEDLASVKESLSRPLPPPPEPVVAEEKPPVEKVLPKLKPRIP